jgi:hypothetical protein
MLRRRGRERTHHGRQVRPFLSCARWALFDRSSNRLAGHTAWARDALDAKDVVVLLVDRNAKSPESGGGRLRATRRYQKRRFQPRSGNGLGQPLRSPTADPTRTHMGPR